MSCVQKVLACMVMILTSRKARDLNVTPMCLHVRGMACTIVDYIIEEARGLLVGAKEVTECTILN